MQTHIYTFIEAKGQFSIANQLLASFWTKEKNREPGKNPYKHLEYMQNLDSNLSQQ